ncbi:MAG: hypothetical protein KJO13_01615, partial [Gammaproteobacteria bacterium]|nr:hypothetical protein [Gammaproteobacteria bacterium]
MATLADLEEQKRELEARLDAGDLSAQAAIARVDRAISARRLKIEHSRKRVAAAHSAVAAGMPAADARKPSKRAPASRSANKRRPLNRFE